MSMYLESGDGFFAYIMDLFYQAGHVATLNPEYANYTAEQFVYANTRNDLYLSRDQRGLLKCFGNISRLFTSHDCSFFSISLSTLPRDRSQMAQDVHKIIHPFSESKASVCVFHCDGEYVLSSAGHGVKYVLSDWYPLVDDFDRFLKKIDIGNISSSSSREYFLDIVFMLAREYYIYKIPPTYALVPTYFFDCGLEDFDRDELNRIVDEQLNAARNAYGYDYIDYEATETNTPTDLDSDLDLLLLELDDIVDDNPFGEELEAEVDFEDELEQDNDSSLDHDEYEFDDVDPEIFLDAALMVKWLQKHDQQ